VHTLDVDNNRTPDKQIKRAEPCITATNSNVLYAHICVFVHRITSTTRTSVSSIPVIPAALPFHNSESVVRAHSSRIIRRNGKSFRSAHLSSDNHTRIVQ
jgi:hypothetical protein